MNWRGRWVFHRRALVNGCMARVRRPQRMHFGFWNGSRKLKKKRPAVLKHGRPERPDQRNTLQMKNSNRVRAEVTSPDKTSQSTKSAPKAAPARRAPREPRRLPFRPLQMPIFPALPGIAADVEVSERDLLGLLSFAVHNMTRELRAKLSPRLDNYSAGRWHELFVIAEQVVRERAFSGYSREGELEGIRLPQLPGLAGLVLHPFPKMLSHFCDVLTEQRARVQRIVDSMPGDARAAGLAEALLLAEQARRGWKATDELPYEDDSGEDASVWRARTAAMDQLTFAY